MKIIYGMQCIQDKYESHNNSLNIVDFYSLFLIYLKNFGSNYMSKGWGRTEKWGSWARGWGMFQDVMGDMGWINQSINDAFANKQIRWWIIMEHSIKSMCLNLHAAYSLHPLSQTHTHTQTHVMDTVIVVINNRRKKTQPKEKGKGNPENLV